jgi:hypothetical protein
LFWGKHIERPPPIRRSPPSIIEQIFRVRQVHIENQSIPRLVVGDSLLDEKLGFQSSISEDVVSSFSSAFSFGNSTCSHGDRGMNNTGRYPLRLSDPWFAPPKNNDRRLRPSLGSLLGDSYHRTCSLVLSSHIDVDDFNDVDMPTPPRSPFSNSQTRNETFPNSSPSLCHDSPGSSSGYSTRLNSPLSSSSATSTGQLPPFDERTTSPASSVNSSLSF